MRRTISAWETAPRDGTPFHILNTLRFNPLSGNFEGLYRTEDGRKWQGLDLADGAPSLWLRLLPLPYEVPTSLAFTVTYQATPKLTWRDRLLNRLFGRTMFMHQWLQIASAIETRRVETAQTGSIHESAVPNGETPDV